jgi:protein-disulfide isomerase
MEKRGRTPIQLFLMVLLLYGLATPSLAKAGLFDDGNKMSKEIKPVPAIELPVPQSESDKSYLGVSGTGTFMVSKITSQILIIEFFSFYCPHCQRVAPLVDKVYREIESRPEIRGKIKIIGIGLANSAKEVSLFKKQFSVPFPLFPDNDIRVARKLSVLGTPTFIALRANDKGVQEQFYFYPGAFDDASQFLTEVVKLSGLR